MAENVKGQSNNSPENTNTGSTSGEDLTAANSDHNNASATRGGTTDMGSEAFRDATGTSRGSSAGSGANTKKSVTGSDYDGQVSE